ncbi:hypothetical protein BDV38DRAFT_260468 [Aspergillus pseudotamarii]|uniref:Uncharacterized protein n=1 Tax=Aspergillus pseudotamarii TaxID=132259 RepID=A0A5N6SFN5_ASPPS|nr:uncharacterized protein BDV38DRAFT_260468 [Aspergillus pseudotamarii]KAE8132679.1 hypothetical protein BDV38DRAFT_260468 [Aspergillus pseudotamarii]
MTSEVPQGRCTLRDNVTVTFVFTRIVYFTRILSILIVAFSALNGFTPQRGLLCRRLHDLASPLSHLLLILDNQHPPQSSDAGPIYPHFSLPITKLLVYH